MNKTFENIRVLIWDFDGTFYQSSSDLLKDMREAEYQVIANHTGWPKEKVIDEFAKIHKKVTPSATEASAILSDISTTAAAAEMEKYYDRRPYISHDAKLIFLFAHLKKYRHFILANGIAKGIEDALVVLGIPLETFEQIVTSEVVGVNKPHEDGFRYILKKTNLPADNHLMIGDREAVDLVPAKAVGMKTCLVWSDQKSIVADIALPTVYDVGTIL